MTAQRSASLLALAAAASTLALAACNKGGAPNATADAGNVTDAAAPLAALPLTDAPVAPSAAAPPAAALPRATPRVARLRSPGDTYAYLDRAYAQGGAYGDAPPDYAFDYGGVRPWVWRANDGAARYAEPLPDGGYRYYFYQPGSDTPYLVRDDGYAYGYSDGALSVVYGPDGRALPPEWVDRRADFASRLAFRAAALYAASQRADRQAVARANWDARRSRIDADRAAWSAGQARDDAWRAYHQAHAADYGAHWDDERERREAEAARLDQSQNDPGRAHREEAAAMAAAAGLAAAGQRPPPQAPLQGGRFAGDPRDVGPNAGRPQPGTGRLPDGRPVYGEGPARQAQQQSPPAQGLGAVPPRGEVQPQSRTAAEAQFKAQEPARQAAFQQQRAQQEQARAAAAAAPRLAQQQARAAAEAQFKAQEPARQAAFQQQRAQQEQARAAAAEAPRLAQQQARAAAEAQFKAQEPARQAAFQQQRAQQEQARASRPAATEAAPRTPVAVERAAPPPQASRPAMAAHAEAPHAPPAAPRADAPHPATPAHAEAPHPAAPKSAEREGPHTEPR